MIPSEKNIPEMIETDFLGCIDGGTKKFSVKILGLCQFYEKCSVYIDAKKYPKSAESAVFLLHFYNFFPKTCMFYLFCNFENR